MKEKKCGGRSDTVLDRRFLMFHGSILGERNTGIARIVGIIGIGFIASSNSIVGGKRYG